MPAAAMLRDMGRIRGTFAGGVAAGCVEQQRRGSGAGGQVEPAAEPLAFPFDLDPLDALRRRPEVDPDRIFVYGAGAGTFWATRLALRDGRVRALATKSGYSSLYYLMNEDAPSYKRLYGFLTQAVTEDELDRLLAKMTVDGQLSQLRCPMLMVSGEYDLRDPVEEVFRLFDQVPGPAELWLFADQFHRPKFTGDRSVHEAILDWLEATLADTPPPTGNPPGNRVRYIEPAAEGMTGPHVTFKRRWFEQGQPTE